MGTGAITNHIDVAQLVLYAFWIFFAGLIIYIRREDKREGYPLESDRSGAIKVQGFPAMPGPKSYRLAHGGTVLKPNPNSPKDPEVLAIPTELWPGAPLTRPATRCATAWVPPLTRGAQIRPISRSKASPRSCRCVSRRVSASPTRAPIRAAWRWSVATGKVGGIVTDAWVDRAEPQVRYLEVEVSGSKRHVLVPMGFSKIDSLRSRVVVRSILASQFEDVPGCAIPTWSRCSRKIGSVPTTVAAPCMPHRIAWDPGCERPRTRAMPGLPEVLPPGERLLWQGVPSWRAACPAFASRPQSRRVLCPARCVARR